MHGKATSQAESARGAIDHLKITGGKGISPSIRQGWKGLFEITQLPQELLQS
jgi:hypothetical protein